MSEKLKLHSLNKADKNYCILANLFPNAVTESIVGYDEDGMAIMGRAIDADVLRQEISTTVVQGKGERYQFTWPDKQKAILAANTPITKTLRPCLEESVEFDTTKNLYIEGDNLDVLKLLQETYLEKIKMIYIDPPYNTGNDFIYTDKFIKNVDQYVKKSGQFDELGNRLVQNIETNGKFHTDWLNMMYPRIKIARNLLTEDGVICISIDDNEIENLKKLGNEIFGDSNFVDILKWKKKKQPSFLAKHTVKVMEYILIYAKNKEALEKLSIEGTSDSTKKVINISNAESLRHFHKGVRVKGEPNQIIAAGKYTIKTMEIEYLNDIIVIEGISQNDVDVRARFLLSQEKINQCIEEGLLFITAHKGLRRDLSKGEMGKRKSITDLLLGDWGDNQESDKEFLDFFSGSATTAHAVMELNAEDNGNRSYICVQIPEATDPKSSAYQDGYHQICQIGKERIRRASWKIKSSYREASFDDRITEETVKEIALRQPYYAVFRDVSYSSDCVSTNFEQIFETYSPTTIRKVL